MQISAGVVFAGGGEREEPLAGTPHSRPHTGRIVAGRPSELAGPVPPGWGSLEPWSSVSVLHTLPFPWTLCNRAEAPRPPPGSLFQSERRARRGGAERLGNLGDCKAPWRLAGPNLRCRDRAPRRAPPGRAEGGLTCQESQLHRPCPSFGLSGTPGPFGTIEVSLHPLPKGLLLLREGKALPSGHLACQRQGQIWNSEPQVPVLGCFHFSRERPVPVV